MACAALCITPVDSSEKGGPVRELILPSVLGEPLADCLHEPMSGEKYLEYAIRTTASVWMSFERVYRVESGDVDFDSFGMAPWDAGGMYSRTLGEPYRTRMLQWLMRLLCRPVRERPLDSQGGAWVFFEKNILALVLAKQNILALTMCEKNILAPSIEKKLSALYP